MSDFGEHTDCGSGWGNGWGKPVAVRFARKQPASFVCLWVLAAGFAACAAALFAHMLAGDAFAALEGASAGEALALLGLLAWESLEAGVLEEVLFRGVILFGLLKLLERVAAGRNAGSNVSGNARVTANANAAAKVNATATVNSRSSLNPNPNAIVRANARANPDPSAGGFHRASLMAALISSALFAFAHILMPLPAGPLGAAGLFALALKFVQALCFGLAVAVLAIVNRSVLAPVLLHSAFDLLYFAPYVLSAGLFPSTYAVVTIPELAALAATVLLLLPPCVRGVRFLLHEC